MRRLTTSALAMLATVMTSAVAVAQTRPVTPPRPNRATQPAPANRDSQPPRARRAAPGRPLAGPGMGGPASNLLRMREQLELTDEQVKKLEALQSMPRPQRNEADLLRARADLMDATTGDINLEKARAAFDRMARVRTDEQLARLKSQQELRSVLNPAQRAKLDALAGRLRDRRGAMMRGRANQRFGQMRVQMRAQPFRGQRPGMRRGEFGPGMGNRRGPNGPPNGPPNGAQGFQPGMRQGMGPGMGPGAGQGMMRRRMNLPPAPPPPDTAR